MKRVWPASALLLGVALIVSNAWWLYGALDAGVSAKYRDQSLSETCSALKQTLAIAPAASRGASRAELVAIAQEAAGATQPFAKDGVTWVGHVGLRFATDGQLIEVLPAWSPFECP